MILCMVLHLLRHFAYDKYRGFRWFSWVSGVMLLWIVYITGINGFMLVWDQMAQFIVIAVAEWFDVLPMFNGTLIRNFLYDGSVNSRLFTLFALIHVGAPLATVLLAGVLEIRGKLDELIGLMRRALEIEPGSAPALGVLARALRA